VRALKKVEERSQAEWSGTKARFRCCDLLRYSFRRAEALSMVTCLDLFSARSVLLFSGFFVAFDESFEKSDGIDLCELEVVLRWRRGMTAVQRIYF
jgi:hypothetical protein